MNLSTVNNAMNNKITSGSEYCWKCYGANARHLDYESEFADVTVVYDSTNQFVYEASVYAKNDDSKLYRWIDPSYRGYFVAECQERKIDTARAWDEAVWCDLEVEEDWLEKATAIFNGLQFDKGILVPIDLDDGIMLSIAMEAHRRNITLNAYINELLIKYINTQDEAVNGMSG